MPSLGTSKNNMLSVAKERIAEAAKQSTAAGKPVPAPAPVQPAPKPLMPGQTTAPIPTEGPLVKDYAVKGITTGPTSSPPVGTNVDFKKKGGKVKAKSSYSSGGKVGSASRRGDGIAQRGKTKGRMV